MKSSSHESVFNLACQDDYKPAHWLPLLQATVAGARVKEESEAAISLQLLATVAEVGEEDVAPHVPEITAAVQGEICHHIPPHPEPWPTVIKSIHPALSELPRYDLDLELRVSEMILILKKPYVGPCVSLIL